MATQNDFSDYYKTISNTELLGILENPGDYQPLAIEAARQELSRRQLSDTDIHEAREPLIAKRLRQQRQAEKVKAVAGKTKRYGYALADLLNPIQTGIPTAEKMIRLIVLVYGGIFLYTIITDYRTIQFLIEDLSRFPLAGFAGLLPFLLLPVAILVFYKRKPAGWMLLTIYVLFSLVSVLWLLLLSFGREYSVFGPGNLFPGSSVSSYFIQVLFFGGTLYALGKQDIRKVFSINTDRMGATIVLTIVLIVFFFFALYSL